MPTTKLDQARDLARSALDKIDGSGDADGPTSHAVHALGVALTLIVDVFEEQHTDSAESGAAPATNVGVIEAVPPPLTASIPPGLYEAPRGDAATSGGPGAHVISMYEPFRGEPEKP